MATTARGIVYPTTSNTITPLATQFANLATSTNTALDTLETSVKSYAGPSVANQVARDALFPSPAQGNRVWRIDLGWEEAYFELYNSSTNPGGATPAGWYPINGILPRGQAYNNAQQSVSSGEVYVNLQVAGALVGGFTLTTNALVVPVTGTYLVNGFVYIWGTSGTYRGASVVHEQIPTTLGEGTTSSAWTIPTVPNTVVIPAGARIRLKTSGDASNTLQIVNNRPMLQAIYMGPPR